MWLRKAELTQRNREEDPNQLPAWFEPHQGLLVQRLQLAQQPVNIDGKPNAPTTAPASTTASLGTTPKAILPLKGYEYLEERDAAASGSGQQPIVVESTAVETFTGTSLFSVVESMTGAQSAVSSAKNESISVSSSSHVGIPAQSSHGSSGNGSSALSGGAIAGIIIGVVLALLLLVLGVVLLLRRRRRDRNILGGDNPRSSSNPDLPEVTEKAPAAYGKAPPANVVELPETQSHNLPPELPTHPMTNVQQVRHESRREEFFTAPEERPVFEAPTTPMSPPPQTEPVPIATVAAPVARKPVAGRTSGVPEVIAEPIVDQAAAGTSANAPEAVLPEDPEIARLREEQARIQEQKDRLLQLQRLEEEQARVQKQLDERMAALGRK